MSRIVIYIICALVIMVFPSSADESELRRIVKEGCYGSLHRPYLDLAEVYKYECDLADAKAVVGLLKKIQSDAYKYRALKLDGELDEGYLLAWKLALQTWINSSDAKARQVIMDEWNRSFMEDSHIHIQIYALGSAWDNAFLNDSFWISVGKNPTADTVRAFRFAVYCKGDKKDYEKFLSERIAAGNERHLDLIKDFDEWLEYRKMSMEFGDAETPQTGYMANMGLIIRKRGDLARLDEFDAAPERGQESEEKGKGVTH